MNNAAHSIGYIVEASENDSKAVKEAVKCVVVMEKVFGKTDILPKKKDEHHSGKSGEMIARKARNRLK